MLLRGISRQPKRKSIRCVQIEVQPKCFLWSGKGFSADLMALAQSMGQNPKPLSTELEWREILSVFYQVFCEGSPGEQERAALAWGQWEQSIMSLEGPGTSAPSDHQRNFEMGLISCHLLLKDPHLLSEQMWSQMHRIETIPCDIVQGTDTMR
jgi:hypothetical protein